MKTFLASIQKIDNNLSIHQKSEAMLVFEDEELRIICSSNALNSLDSIAQSYKEKSITFLSTLEGSFSCLLLDKTKNLLFIAKDKVGIEPLYYSNTKENIIVGTHLRDFKNISTFQPTVKPSSVGEYLQFGFVMQPNTILQNCYKVCSGEYVCFDLNKNTHTSEKYWALESCYVNEKIPHNEEELLKQTDELLHKIIEKSTNNSKFGLSLSGGYDSSTLTALCQIQSDTQVDTFTIGFHDENINEAPHAKAIAKHLNTKHTEYYFNEKDALELIPKMCQVFDEPFADHASTPTILTSQLLQQNNISKLIAGDGGDEVFATAEDVQTFEYIQKVPMPLKKLFAKSINSIKTHKLPYLKNYNNLPKKQNKLSQLLLAKNIPQMIYSRNTLFLEEELHTHIQAYTRPIQTSFDNIDFPKNAQAVDKVIGSYFKTTMADGELVKSYASMNHLSIELSTPFLDAELIHHMATVPSSIKIKGGTKKYLLKEIAHQYIPKELIDRPKSGFDIPFSTWMKGILKDILYLQINKKRLDEDNIFYTSSILNIRDQFYAGNEAYKYKLWRIFIFQLWYENFTQSIHNKG